MEANWINNAEEEVVRKQNKRYEQSLTELLEQKMKIDVRIKELKEDPAKYMMNRY